jgi:hypothetical protein
MAATSARSRPTRADAASLAANRKNPVRTQNLVQERVRVIFLCPLKGSGDRIMPGQSFQKRTRFQFGSRVTTMMMFLNVNNLELTIWN